MNKDRSYPESRVESNIDLAFLHADPMVTKTETGELKEYIVPLDLDEEYNMLTCALSETNRRFTISKEAIDHRRMKLVLRKSPIMIHISCHGSYDKV